MNISCFRGEALIESMNILKHLTKSYLDDMNDRNESGWMI